MLFKLYIILNLIIYYLITILIKQTNNMSNKIISFRGYINGERKSSPELSKTISELIDNHLDGITQNTIIH